MSENVKSGHRKTRLLFGIGQVDRALQLKDRLCDVVVLDLPLPDGKSFFVNLLISGPVAAEVVRMISDLYLQGCGKTQIAQWLNDRGIPSPAAYKRGLYDNYYNPNRKETLSTWDSTGINLILGEQMYPGDLVQGKTKKSPTSPARRHRCRRRTGLSSPTPTRPSSTRISSGH